MKPIINGCGGRVPPEEIRRRFQDRNVLTQPSVLGLEALDLSRLLAGLPITDTSVDIGLHDPSAQRFRTDTLLPGYDRDRLRGGRILGPVLEHEPDSLLSHLGINLLRHDAILSTRKEAASNLGRFRIDGSDDSNNYRYADEQRYKQSDD